MASHNGWKNRQTWNVALWIGNDEGLYRAAVDYAKRYRGRATYRGFITAEGLNDDRTPDNIAWAGARLDYRALTSMIRELVED